MKIRILIMLITLLLVCLIVNPSTGAVSDYNVTVAVGQLHVIEDRDFGLAEIYLKAVVDEREPKYTEIFREINDGDVLQLDWFIILDETLNNFSLRIEVWESDDEYNETENDFLGYVEYTRESVLDIEQWHDAQGRIGGNYDLQARIYIIEKANEIAGTPHINRSPLVSVDNPRTGDSVSGIVTVQWTAIEPDGDSLQFSLFYSDDAGVTWNTIVSGITVTSYNWNATAVPDGENYAILVNATDGELVTSASSGVFIIDNNQSPIVSVDNPRTGDSVSGIVTVRWTAIDPDGDNLQFSLYYSDDAGATWNAVVSGITATSYNWNTTVVPNGENYVILVNATDGELVTTALSGTFIIDNQSEEEFNMTGVPFDLLWIILTIFIPLFIYRRKKVIS